MAQVSIVVPVYHNAASLGDLLGRFQTLASNHPEDRFEFVFVDDGSKDNSFAVLHELAQCEPRMRVIKLSRNFGSNAAILAGLDEARGDVVAAISADLQDPPELIGEMLARWRSGRKIVLAARQTRQDSWLTTLTADAFYFLFRRLALPNMPRRGFDFFLIDRQVRDVVVQMPEKNLYLMGLLVWLGFDADVVHYDRRSREQRYGRSMWTLAKKAHYFIDAFVAFSYVPLRAASLVGFLTCLASGAYALYIVLSRLLWSRDVPGWGSLMVIVLMTSGLQLLLTGVLGEYVWRNLDEARRRPRYIVDRILPSAATADPLSPRSHPATSEAADDGHQSFPGFPRERAA
jgi:glycosyltransferase involved in cell wall biosynthesis